MLFRSYDGYSRDMVKINIGDGNGNPIYLDGKKLDSSDIKMLFIDNQTVKVTNMDDTPVNDEDIQLYIDMNMTNLPSRSFNGVCNELISVIKKMNTTLGHRNNKKDDYHLNTKITKYFFQCFRLFFLLIFHLLTPPSLSGTVNNRFPDKQDNSPEDRKSTRLNSSH